MSCGAKPAELQERFAAAVHDAWALHFFGCDADAELNVSAGVPDFIDIDVAVDSGAGCNVLAAVDAPCHAVKEPPGSRRGGEFKGVGGHVVANG